MSLDPYPFILEDFKNQTSSIKKAEGMMHLMLVLSLTIGGLFFSFLKDLESNSKPQVIKLILLSISSIQFLIGLNYIGRLRNYLAMVLYVRELNNYLNSLIAEPKLKPIFLRWEEFTRRFNNSNKILLILNGIAWGVPMIIPSLLGSVFLALALGPYNVNRKCDWAVNDWLLGFGTFIILIFVVLSIVTLNQSRYSRQ